MSFIDEDHVYSYSQLSSFDECHYGFYLERIEGEEQLSNAFAEQGSLIHDIIDKWAKHELTKEQMVEEYDRRYSQEVVTNFPRVLAAKGYTEKAYQLGYDYFDNFDEFNGYKIISTEEKFKIEIPLTDGTTRTFVGVVDMILEDEFTEELIICDHKSKSLQAFKKSEDEMYRQQLLYSLYVHKKYGRWPDIMMFNLFKEQGMKMQRKFTETDLNKALEWATNIIHNMENFELIDWLESKDQDFFCTEICSMRKVCPNGISKPKKNTTKTTKRKKTTKKKE